jgi:hypothetical protein
MLIDLLHDDDEGVRLQAVHALAGDRCKTDGDRPAASDVLDPALDVLRGDPSPHVRAMAVELVGRFVHSHGDAERALVAVAELDPSLAVRKKARWYAPGGTIHTKSAVAASHAITVDRSGSGAAG